MENKIFSTSMVRQEYNKIISMENDLNLGYEIDMVTELLDEIEKEDNGKYYINQTIVHEIADSNIPNHDLKNLLNMYKINLNLLDYVNYAKDEGLITNDISIIKELKIGIYYYNQEILNTIINHYNIEVI